MRPSRKFWPISAIQVQMLVMVLVVSISFLFSSCINKTFQSRPPSDIVLKTRIYHLAGQSKMLQGLRSGQFTQFTLPIPFLPSPYFGQFGIGNIVKGPDGAMWFEQKDDGLIGRITSSGNLTIFQLPNYLGPEASPLWMATGLDNALWFVDGGVIGRITFNGTLTVFFLPNPEANPLEITTGKDGTLWFAEGGRQSKIARLTTRGVFTEFSVPSVAGSITTGLDGTIWFSEFENSSGKIARITSNGKLSEFPIPDAIEENELTTGPDGDIWFSTNQTTSNQIGRMTPDGHFTFFSLGTTSLVEQIADDGNGSLVFTAVDANMVGIMTVRGGVSKLFSIPQAHAYPFALAMREPGEYWFTEIGERTASGMGMIDILNTN